MSRPAFVATLAGLLILAAVLRLWGLTFGFPALTHADEPQVVRVAVNAATGQLSPGFFAYPALFPYLAAPALRLAALVQPGTYPDFQAFFDRYCSVPQPAYLVVRACSALTGVAAVAATACLGRRIGGQRVGLIAAALLAVNVLAVRDSHFATTDVPAMLAATLALIAILAALDAPGFTRVVLAGAAVGIAAGTRYHAGALALPLVLVLAWRARLTPRLAADLGVAAVCAVAAFLAVNPFLLLDLGTVRADLAIEWERRLGAEAQGAGVPAWRWYLGEALPFAFGWAGMALVAAGLAFALRERRGRLLAVALVALALVAPACAVRSVGARYLLPSFPMLAVLGAWGAARLADLARPRGARGAAGVLALLIAAGTLPPLERSVRVARLLALPDTRVLAAAWIREHVPPGARIALEWAYVPEVDPDRYAVQALRYEAGGPDAQGADWIVVSSHAFGRYFLHPERHQAELAFFRALETGPPPAVVLDGLPAGRSRGYIELVPPGPLDQRGMVGPEIRIYRLGRP